ncbi:MAG: redoxin family protein [Methylacidiphilales bacterium]|nr:redoxin family protein [Candidatus Methylacidiphilales bacterium]
MKKSYYFAGMVVLVLFTLLIIGLFKSPSSIPSPLLGKPLPQISLELLFEKEKIENTLSACTKPYCLVTIWASWCASCVAEHAELVILSSQPTIALIGITHQDTRDQAQEWINKRGNPYAKLFFDQEGNYGFLLGSYGVPESFLLDKNKIVLHRWAGPVHASEVLQLINTKTL